MNNSLGSMNNLDKLGVSQYSDNAHSIEIATLQQSVPLPKLSLKKKLCHSILKSAFESTEYKLMEKYYQNMEGHFYISIMFPLVESGEPTQVIHPAANASNVLNKTIKPQEYIEQNFITLKIPKYICMNFKDEIPAGTKFLVAYIGGNQGINNLSIIGLYGPGLE